MISKMKSRHDKKVWMHRRKKQRTRKKRKRLKIFVCLLLLIYIFFIMLNKKNIFYDSKIDRIVKNVSKDNLDKPRTYSDTAIRDKLEKLAETSSKYREIYNHIDCYPMELLAALCSNSEMLEFTLGYKNRDNSLPCKLTKKEFKEKYPLLMQWDKRWGYASYGDSCIGLTGCAPTCLSMAILALTDHKDATPDKVAIYAQDAGFYMKGTGTSWSFMTEGASHFGINGTEIRLSRSTVFSELKSGHPIICSMGPGDFTTQGHFIVLVGEKDGKIIVNDPNSKERSNVLWEYDVLERQIKNLWAYSI